MFEVARITIAKNRVIVELAHEGHLGKEAESMMSMVAGNRQNYGVRTNIAEVWCSEMQIQRCGGDVCSIGCGL
jgi:hypothetical protein